MNAFFLAGVLAAAQQPALPPPDWSALPTLALRRSADATMDTSAYVRDEVTKGRCAAATRDAAGWTLGIDVAVLATAEGRVRRVVPRAIQCPTVEQYAAGLVLSAARDNVDPLPAEGDHWYRTHLTFAWGS